ncbi:OmpA family protein [Actinomadura madurae]|uniref:OmpA family protein n=1 Tax=Actinomadura madurae TaxID=1993 RepID=UPI0020D244A7|nr:OmpA family protein [Actinomadura madurae]MCP9950169.1 OmpA family protein [Actinomadura madurae]MCP9966934.1 OmpA family protein [Actinomadura madurae]MCQ0009065.1 OmpA family protein [Actinomadura madurae]MCQ0015618.1 OmpA family protein [Actinomadura madurae]
MRRPIVIAGVLALVLAVPAVAFPAVAGADPSVPDESLPKSVLSIGADGAVHGIDLSKAVVPLEEEESDGRRVTVRISADVLFDFNKATLTEAARRRLASLAPRLRDATGTVRVSGHSDSIGDPGYNLRLSEQRAEAVTAELRKAVAGAGLRIEAKGYGETRPVAPNEQGGKDDPAGRAKNRRVEVTYEKG